MRVVLQERKAIIEFRRIEVDGAIAIQLHQGCLSECNRGFLEQSIVDAIRSHYVQYNNPKYNSFSSFDYITMQVEVKQVQPKRFGPFSMAIFIFSFLLNYLMLRHTSSGHLLNSYIFPELSFDGTLDEASKWLMVRIILAKVGLFLFFNMCLVFLCRAATKKIAPALDDDPVIIKTFNRILQNSLEQIAIFGSLYFYFLFDKAGDRFTFDELLVFASWFIYSRVFFMIFYSIGTYVNMVSLRSFGFGVNMALNFMLVELCFSPATPLSNHIFGK